jgi:hypothetical protein
MDGMGRLYNQDHPLADTTKLRTKNSSTRENPPSYTFKMPRSAGGSTEVDEYSLDFRLSAANVDEFTFKTQGRYVPLAFAGIPGGNDCAEVMFALPKGVCHEANANTQVSVLRKQVRAIKITSRPEGNWSSYHRNFVARIEALKELAGTC